MNVKDFKSFKGNGSNGHASAIPGQNIPIVGQPFALKNFFITVQIVCNCAAKEPILLVGHGPAQCPACHQGFQFSGLGVQNGQLQFKIGLVRQQEPPPGDEAGPEGSAS